MSLLDVLLVVLVGTSVVAGFRAGLARASVGFVAAIAAIVFGFWFYGIPAAWFRERLDSETGANLFGFLTVFGATLVAGSLLGQLLSKIFKWTGLSWLDRILGAAFGLVRGALIGIALVAVLMAFTPKPIPNWISESYLLPYAVEASDWCAELAPHQVKEAFGASLREIRETWQEQVERAGGRRKKPEGDAPKGPPPKSVDQ
jgi:membrane protein required for colicin V production